MPTYKTRVIIISYMKFKEADKIIRAYSPHFGRISAIAKGARKTKSKFGARLEPFSYCELVLYKGRNLDIVTQIEILEPFLNIKENLKKLAYAYIIADLILRSGGESDSARIFPFFLFSLKELQKIDESLLKQWLIAFQLKFMILSGYKPILDKCSYCGRKIERLKKNVFSFSDGGLLCDDCSSKKESPVILKSETVKMLRDLTEKDIKDWNKTIYSNFAQDECQKVLENYIYYYLESKLKTIHFLREIESKYK